MSAAIVAGRAPNTDVQEATEARIRPRFMHRPAADILLALAWVPFAVVCRGLENGGDGNGLALFISGVFLLSFAHQPLTVALVYGDAEQFRLKKAIFTWSPIIFVVAVVAGYYVSFVLVAVIGGLWNAEHTLMQRYGVTRIYGRMAGQDDGGIEKAMLFSWLVAALLWAAADPATPGRIAQVSFGENNRVALEVLTQYRSVAAVLVWPAFTAVAFLVALWVRNEVARPRLNPAKWIYLGSTAILFGLMLVDPLAGIMGYVGAHALEYFVIVYQSLGRRYGAADAIDQAPLGRAVRARPGRAGFMVIYVGVVIGIISVLERLGSPLAYSIVFFTLGGLHVFYDGFIWKLRRPAVAKSLAIDAS